MNAQPPTAVDPALASIVLRFLDVFNSGDLEALEALVAEDCVDGAPIPGQLPGHAGVRQKASLYRAAFPDAVTVVEEIAPTGDSRVVQVTWVTTSTEPDGPRCQSGCRFTALFTLDGGRLRENRILCALPV